MRDATTIQQELAAAKQRLQTIYSNPRGPMGLLDEDQCDQERYLLDLIDSLEAELDNAS
jgi:hypothetical protein